MRVTDNETMDIVEMGLGDLVNKEIVNLIRQSGRLNRKRWRFIRAKKIQQHHTSLETDDTEIIGLRLAPIGVGEDGRSYNNNADLFAGKLAEVLKAEKIILLTNTAGILDKQEKLLTNLSLQDIDDLIADGTISGGMIPKTRCATDALKGGVNNVLIIDGRVDHAVLLELFTDQGVGTLLLRAKHDKAY